MPDFGHPFSGLANGRKLSESELIRAIRFMVSAEYEAIQLYLDSSIKCNRDYLRLPQAI